LTGALRTASDTRTAATNSWAIAAAGHAGPAVANAALTGPIAAAKSWAIAAAAKSWAVTAAAKSWAVTAAAKPRAIATAGHPWEAVADAALARPIAAAAKSRAVTATADTRAVAAAGDRARAIGPADFAGLQSTANARSTAAAEVPPIASPHARPGCVREWLTVHIPWHGLPSHAATAWIHSVETPTGGR
jgi:hypothetical protein